MQKHCRRCDVIKPDSDFFKDAARHDGLQVYCKSCMATYEPQREGSRRWYQRNIEAQRQRARDYQAAHREERAAYRQKYVEENKDILAAKIKIRQQADKRVVFDAYGGRCICCGENTPAFLTIDHIANGRGNPADRLKTGAGTAFYRWLKRANFPADFQVLCFNCNCGRSINGGICPHQEESSLIALSTS